MSIANIFTLIYETVSAALCRLAIGSDQKKLDELAKTLTIPEQIYDYMVTNFQYQHDPIINITIPPDVMVVRQKGDCEDYANFAKYILNKNGYEAFMVFIYTKKEAHAVCVFRKHTPRYRHISNWGITRSSFSNIEEIAKSIYDDWEMYEIINDNLTIKERIYRKNY